MRTHAKAIFLAVGLSTATAMAYADMVEVNGANLYHETVGDGPAVLIMHGGLGLSHGYLRPYFDVLAETHTVVYYDHFGNGQSDKPDDYAEMTFERLVADADALMTELGHDTFTLIGHSYGGFVAQEFAVAHGDRLDGLVLIDTVPAFDYAPTVSGTEVQMEAFGRLFGGPMADNAEWRATWGLVVQMYFHEWDDAVGAELDARTVYEYQAWNAAGALLATFNTLESLPNIEVPALVIAGRRDGITPPEPGAERIADLLPNAELAVFENSGHYPFIEEQEAFFDVLEAWMNR